MTLIAFDYGTRKIGVAVGNLMLFSASPLSVLPVFEGEVDRRALLKLLEEWKPRLILVGLPLTMQGDEDWIAKRARVFAQMLELEVRPQVSFEFEVLMRDERLSSFEARSLMQERLGPPEGKASRTQLKVDALAAWVILQSYLDEQQGLR